MDTAEFLSVAHETLTRTVLRAREGEQRTAASTPDVVQAVLLLFAMTLLPVLVRVRVLYTFCWVGFTVLAHVMESEAALGMATSLGLTIMMGWYSLRVLDRATFMGILQGWFGFLSKYRPFRLLANSVDFLLHMGVPLTLAFCYLPLVRIWMTVPILLFSQVWIKLVAGGDLCDTGNDVYHIYPPRPKTFWLAVRKIELVYNFTVPTFCVLAYQMDTLLGWGTLGRASHAVQADDQMDTPLAVALLFGVVVLPPLVGVRTMYTNCWFVFTVLAHLLTSEAALGIATSMGITIMVGWYSLRVFDRYAFTAILNGWLGVWASSPLLGFAARVGDFMLHLLVPMLLVSCYLPLVRVWMSVPALISSRLWSHFVVGGGVFPKADHIYRFSPPRSQHFWNAAYKMELMLNLLVPLFCVLAHQRSFWVYVATAIAGAVLFCLQLIRSLSLPKLRKNAKTIMCRLLSSGGIRPNVDFIVRDDSFWLDWMSEGLVAIGESYVGCLWATNSARTLDEVVASLLTIPMEGRQEMYRSWSARFVALAARLFNYPPSSMGLVVGAVSEQFDLCPQFRQVYMDRYFHQGFGIWTSGTTKIDDAQTNKLANVDQLLDIRTGHTVLDISVGSWGGVGCYLAQQHPDASIVCVLSSVQEFARAKKFARQLEVFEQMEFVVAETPEKMLTILSGFRASKFDRITLCGVVETVPDTQRTRFLRTLKRIQTANGTTLLEFSACTAAHMTTHAWTNKYVHSAFPCHAITLPLMRLIASETGFTLRDTLGYSDHYERTFLEWNRRFQAQWGHDSAGQGMPSLPESFKRTWEFYLLHSAACYRSGALQVFQIRMG